MADHLGSARVITRATDGKMVWRWDQADPFGMFSPQEIRGASGAFVYDPRFPGQVYDRETNNHYNYFRDYDPQIGRYIQSDPVGLAGGINTYDYVGSNPMSYSDLFGLAPGDKYKTMNAAGRQAVNDINARSIALDREFIECIYCNPDGTYSYTAPHMGTDRSAPPEFGAFPAGKKQAAWYHSHGAYRPNVKNNVFSGPDQWWSDNKFGPGYLGTTNNRILRYEPNGVPYDGPATQIGTTK